MANDKENILTGFEPCLGGEKRVDTPDQRYHVCGYCHNTTGITFKGFYFAHGAKWITAHCPECGKDCGLLWEGTPDWHKK